VEHRVAVRRAADAAARVKGGPGVAVVTYGAGALNLVNPVAAAYAEKSPLVVISGAPGQREGRGGLLLHHQVKRLDSQYAIYREITCDQASLHDVASAPAEIARVLQSCLTQSRPVYLELPRDVVLEACAPVPRLPEQAFDPCAVAACAETSSAPAGARPVSAAAAAAALASPCAPEAATVAPMAATASFSWEKLSMRTPCNSALRLMARFGRQDSLG
jgi:indolepyruvate decarboxylase